ncbi:alpha/beta fold hydrolase [Lichenibacterium ramalinae]|uniref:Alpha/beta fold hydrolase n=1 Tax=Lichenibacterium ramalinae TaxID=2316527 RepID=A0A4Q2RBC1_9HYPH|nr:alpha/beta fold hydrolase [Lichenibacterium ramalinae]RYB03730.1 alpha/beta fold hydrolase [Lichenibacterium ramalinae]
MTRIPFTRDDAALQGYVSGTGLPLLYQHGLGGAEAQVAETVPDHPGVRRLTLECRGHGASRPGTRRPFSIGLFAEDALAFCDAEGVGDLVVGGTSMGAAIALRIAVRHPGRVRGLILARPAWLFAAAPETLRPYVEAAAAMRAAAPAAAKAAFAASPTGRRLAAEAPDNYASLIGFFDAPDLAALADILADIAGDGPGVDRQEAAALAVPTLVIGHGEDLVHPLATAEALAATIPGARLARIPSKQSARPAHVAAFRAAVADFLAPLT